MEDIRLFAKTLLIEAGFETHQLLDDIVDDTVDVIMDRLLTVIALALDSNDKDVFLELLETNETADAAWSFAQMKIQNFDELVAQTLEEIRTEYLEDSEEL